MSSVTTISRCSVGLLVTVVFTCIYRVSLGYQQYGIIKQDDFVNNLRGACEEEKKSLKSKTSELLENIKKLEEKVQNLENNLKYSKRKEQENEEKIQNYKKKEKQNEEKIQNLEKDLKQYKNKIDNEKPCEKEDDDKNNNKKQELLPIFSKGMSSVAMKAATTSREEFMKKFDYGLPVPQKNMVSRELDPGSSEVLLLYREEISFPKQLREQETSSNSSQLIKLLPLDDAVNKCNSVITVHLNSFHKNCVALMSGYGNSHILRYKKEKPKNGKELSSSPQFKRLRVSNEKFIGVPSTKIANTHRKRMQRYWNNLDGVLSELDPILSKIARDNTVVAMTGNMGYMSMVMNFICFANSRNISLDNVIFFMTDQESYDIINEMGLTAFNTKKVLGDLPKREGGFMDADFNLMTWAQMACVHLVNALGYNLLFQDADVIWYKDPLDYFLNNNTLPKDNFQRNYDVYFMDDGGASFDFEPWRANTGFFYFQNNDRTRYLSNELLVSGDILGIINDQTLMQVLMSEISNRHGLRVKTLPWYEFTGGKEYHHNEDFVNNIIDDNNKDVWIWHMNWAFSVDKIPWMEQSGWWNLQKYCINKNAKEIFALGDDVITKSNNDNDLISRCCSVKPLIKCNDPDKPSVKQCRKKIEV